MRTVTHVTLRGTPLVPSPQAGNGKAPPVTPPRTGPLPVEPTEVRLTLGERLGLAYTVLTADLSLQDDVAIVNNTTTLLPGYTAMKKDPKTTAAAIAGGILAGLAYFGIGIPEAWTTPIIIVMTFLLGWLGGDEKKEEGK